MADQSDIEWTDATWNPLRGCSRVSAGCQNCYAERIARRFDKPGQAYNGLIHRTGAWNGKITLVPEKLAEPIRWQQPRRIFVNSMSDLFHENVPFEYIDRVFLVMACTTRHTYQILTKRPQRMLQYFERLTDGDLFTEWFPDLVKDAEWPGEWIPQRKNHGGYDCCGPGWPLENVWLGVSVEDQATADERIPLLLKVPAAARFLSCEPLLGSIRFPLPSRGSLFWSGLHWVIAGGESGPGARPAHPHWFRELRDQCVSAGVPYFFKQWGEWGPPVEGEQYNTIYGHAGQPPAFLIDFTGNVHCTHEAAGPSAQATVRVGKKAAGRVLDGRTWDEYPQ